MESPLLFFVDWLSVTYVMTDLSPHEITEVQLNSVENFIIERVEGTNTFNSRFIVSDLIGVKKLTILANPKSSLINSDIMHVQFANSTLYSGEWVELREVLQQLHTGYIHSISRLDICVDFQYYLDENGKKFHASKLARKLTYGKYYVKGKQSGASFYEYKVNKNKEIVEKFPKQISWGSPSSQMKWKLYNKTKEIVEESKKYYIQKIHEKNGMEKDKDVWRLEVSLTKCQNLQMVDDEGFNYLSIDYLTKYDNVAKFLLVTICNHFNVKVNDGQKNKSRNRDVKLFNYTAFPIRFEKISNDVSTCRSSVKTFVGASVTALNDVLFSYKKSLFDGIAMNLIDTVERFSLEEFFEYVYKKDVRTMVSELRAINNNNNNKKTEVNNEFQCEVKFE